VGPIRRCCCVQGWWRPSGEACCIRVGGRKARTGGEKSPYDEGFSSSAEPMPSLNMEGPYKLTEAEVDCVVTRRSPGSYALGRVHGDTFVLKYGGRSDSDARGLG